MSYKVIARKYRPSTFAEVIGQEHITETISRSIASGKQAHAYLFSGPHGVGKTSLARIIAKALNCVTGPTATPCGTCDSCKQIADGNPLDVIEIDGASNRGIDNIREIIESVRISPAAGRFKIYIIDEVHQITVEAFNALLKTLEEPPSHVVFILATTEAEKVLPTIRSRCQQYRFKTLSIDDIERILKKILENEKVTYEEEALFLIARHSRGSVRDSETILEKMIAYTGGKITAADVTAVVGSNNFGLVRKLLTAMQAGDNAAYFALIAEIRENGIDVRTYLANVIAYLRVAMLMKAGINDVRVLEVPAAERDELAAFVDSYDERELENIVDYTLDLDYKVRNATDPLLIFELRGLKLLDVTDLIRPADLLRTAPVRTAAPAQSPAAEHAAASAPSAARPAETQRASVSGDDSKAIFFKKVLASVNRISPAVFSYISQGNPIGKEGATLIVALPSNIINLTEEDKRTKDVIREAIAENTTRKDITIKFVPAENAHTDQFQKVKEFFDGKAIDSGTNNA
ncbi:MAG: DNA polymerase III subunit gamma/tau [Spirochaetes bacterium]|nr:DNA polymerase III subunit gamma/tau [Spirochaetota bacterium]